MGRAAPDSADSSRLDRAETESPTPTHAFVRDRRWWAALILFFVLAAAWAFASPLFSVPDEAAHTVKAAAVDRGELLGRKLAVPDKPGTILRGGFTVVVRVPTSYTWNSSDLPNCYISTPRTPASCAPKFVDNPHEARWTTWVGRYPPTYYALVGWPTLFNTGTLSVYLGRLLSAVLFAALLATAIACAWEAPEFRLLALGVVLAATPTAVFLAGGVNPSGLEIAAAICLWSSLSVAVLADRPVVPTHLLVAVAASGIVLTITRPISALWVVLAVGTVLALAHRDRIVDLLRRHSSRIVAGLVTAAVIAGAAWTLLAGTLGNEEGEDPRGLDFVHALRHSLRRTPTFFREMVGVFGWRTTPAPTLVYWAWGAVLLVVVVLALRYAGRRAAWTVVTLIGLAILVPVVLEAANAHDKGFSWQGRYGLPLAVGIPIVAAVTLGRAAPLSRRATAWLAGGVTGVVALVQVVAFYGALRRYAVGTAGPLVFFGHAGWEPPLPAWLLVLAVLGASAGLAALTYRVATGPSPRGNITTVDDPGAPASSTTPATGSVPSS